MTKFNQARIGQMWADEDLQEFFKHVEAKLTQKVMSPSISPEARDKELANYHGLQSFKGMWRAIANEDKKE